MTVAEWNALSLGPLAGKRERKEVQNRFSTWKASVEFTRTLNLVETGGVDNNSKNLHKEQAITMNSQNPSDSLQSYVYLCNFVIFKEFTQTFLNKIKINI